MYYFIIGVSHHQAPVAVREKLVGLEHRLYDLQVPCGELNESLVIATCNRLEVLAVADDLAAGRQAVLQSLAGISGWPVPALQPYLHEFTGLEAARHLFRVASSLDSLVLGEPQILGQVKEAFREALNHRRSGPLINRLMHKSFRAAKRVRSETSLGSGPVSMAGAAVALARALGGGDLSDKSALILGAGPMAALSAAHLQKRSPAALTILNRTPGKAEILAAKNGGVCRPWAELDAALLEADLVIAATAAPSPILTLDRLKKIMNQRPDRTLTIIDLGLPRNAGHSLKHLTSVILRNIDDLKEVVWESRAARQEAADRAEAIIEDELARFGQWLTESLASQPTVTALTRKAENIRQSELARTLRRNNFSPEQTASLEAMTSALVRRLLHDPLAFIKSAPEGGGGYLNSIRRAFNLETDEGRPGS